MKKMKMPYNQYRLSALICLLVQLIFLCPPTVHSAVLGGRIRLTVGQQRVLDVAFPLEQVAIGDPQVADVKIVSKGKQLLITAIAQGVTDVLTWDLKGKQISTLIQVVTKDIRIVKSEVKGILRDIEGIEIRSVGDRVVIDGEIFTRSDFDRIKKVEEIYTTEVVVLARMSSSITRLIATEINRSLQKNGYTDVIAEGMGDKIFLEGVVISDKDLGTIEALTGAYFDNYVNLVKIGGKTEKLILIDIHFVEIGKRFLEKLGFTWDDLAKFSLSNLSYVSDFMKNAGAVEIREITNFGVAVEMLETRAIARSLANPRLVCKSGEEAKFVAGGEIATPIVLMDRMLIKYKDYGIILELSPIAHRDGRVSTYIKAENSTLDFSTQVLDIPGFKTRRVETHVTLDKDNILVLSGLVNHSDAKDIDNLPIIGKFPIIGEFFKSRQLSDDNTELVIFMTARILDEDDKVNYEIKQTIEEKYQVHGDEIEPDIFD